MKKVISHGWVKAIGLVLISTLSAAVTSVAMGSTLELAWEKKDFKAPESMLFDKERNMIYVSNVNGKPNEKDSNGFISQLSADGKKVNHEWITGLNAPKGLALVNHLLYVADINTLVVIDVNEQKIVKRYLVEKAKFLNDVVADKSGDVYVSDFLDNTIYRLKDDKFTVWLADEKLETPNGLLIENGKLLIASWGVMTDGFATKVPGHMKSVDLKSKEISSLGGAKPIGNLDGVESDGKGNYFVSDWMAGAVYSVKPTGEFSTLLDLESGSADLGIMPNMLLIPMMNDNLVRGYSIKEH